MTVLSEMPWWLARRADVLHAAARDTYAQRHHIHHPRTAEFHEELAAKFQAWSDAIVAEFA